LSTENEWSNVEEIASDSENDASDSEDKEDESPNKFGPIPHFSRVYKVTVDPG
jgi:hypothetical protein